MNAAITLIALGLLAAGGCASKPTPEVTQPPAQEAVTTGSPAMAGPGTRGDRPHGHGHHDDEVGMCPMAVEGTTVHTEDVDGGIAMVFVTTGDQAELRERVARMAKMHDEHHAEGQHAGHHADHGAGHHADHGGGGKVPASAARVEDVDGGARLVLTPRDPAELPALVEHVRGHAEAMATGSCPMMSKGDATASGGGVEGGGVEGGAVEGGGDEPDADEPDADDAR